MTAILSNLQAVNASINNAARTAQRDVANILLLAVSKTVPANVVREAYSLGQKAYGENFVQEALDKMRQLSDLPLEWHFIGPIQSNKTRAIAENFSWVHSVDRLKIAQRLSEQRPDDLPPLNICIQINISGEATKGGVAADEAESLARSISALPRLKLRGLMTIPAPVDDPAEQRIPFAHMRTLLTKLNSAGLALDTLSMGMSHDMTAAILEGATIVRVGTAIFGNRSYDNK
jgi:hypothetical protein